MGIAKIRLNVIVIMDGQESIVILVHISFTKLVIQTNVFTNFLANCENCVNGHCMEPNQCM